MDSLRNARPPITDNIGFVKAPLASVVRFCDEWMCPQGAKPAEWLTLRLDEALNRLLPMTGWRALFIACADQQWTALFRDSSDNHELPIGYICKNLKCPGVVATQIEDTFDAEWNTGQLGGTQLRIFEDKPTAFLNRGRSLSVTREMSGWRFHAGGDPLPFESLDRYRKRRVQDRFTFEILCEYLLAMGIDAFSPSFYSERCALYERA